MATLIPALTRCLPRMTAGERRLAKLLERCLDSDYLIWYDVPIGCKRQQPDFIILHPQRGIFVLEVKDWQLGTIQQVDRQSVQLLLPTGVKVVQNPLAQARNYLMAIVNLLEQDKLLVQPDGRYRGKLAFPYSAGVVLSGITRKQFEAAEGLQEVLDADRVRCKDEIGETIEAGELQQWLWNLCTYEYGEPLTSTQIDRVRWHLFPEVRIDQVQLDLWDEPTVDLPDLLRVMDLQQEQLARSLGEGHRVVHGVAGSGKTLILVYRCLHLVEQTTQPILVLCFNVTLAAKLRQVLHQKGVGDRVIVRNFHRWCLDLLRQYRIAKPPAGGKDYYEAIVQRVIQSVEVGLIPAGQYGAVLIDEGHDFQPQWLKLAAQMVNPETNALLLLYDDAQTIYEQQQRPSFTFKSLGIQAQGRTTVLKLNYRNTQEVLAVAYAFAQKLLTPTAQPSEDAPILIQPQSAGRHGPPPELIRLPSFKQEIAHLIDRIQDCAAEGIAWNDIAILYRSRFMGEQIYSRFQGTPIPIEWVNRTITSRDFRASEPSVKLMTMHASKGLEFPVVLIPGLGYLPVFGKPIGEEARLLYVAMTRAIDRLILSGDRDSRFVRRLETVLGGE